MCVYMIPKMCHMTFTKQTRVLTTLVRLAIEKTPPSELSVEVERFSRHNTECGFLEFIFPKRIRQNFSRVLPVQTSSRIGVFSKPSYETRLQKFVSGIENQDSITDGTWLFECYCLFENIPIRDGLHTFRASLLCTLRSTEKRIGNITLPCCHIGESV